MTKEFHNKPNSPFLKMTEKIQLHRSFLGVKVFLGLLCIILLIIFMTNIKSQKNNQENEGSVEKDAAYGQSELSQNLEYLRQEINARTKQFQTSLEKPEADQTAIYDQAYLARQNAPTLMYSLDAPPRQPASLSQPPNAIFSGAGSNETFANQIADTSDIKAKKIMHPEKTLVAGEFIHAVLETAIQSNLPGLVRAIVTTPVYAYTGNTALIPAGSRLMGQYASAIVQGQARVMVIWNRIVLPNGITVQLNSPGTDALGRAGQSADHLDQHFFERFSQAALLSLIGAGVSTIGVGSGDQQNAADTYRTVVAESFEASANDSLKQNAGIKPTLHIHQGQKINVFVSKDVSF